MDTRNRFSDCVIGLEARGAFKSIYHDPTSKEDHQAKLKVTLRSTMSFLAKQQIGACVHSKAHLNLGEPKSKRFYGSRYKDTLLSGVLRVETEAGKGK